MMNKECGVYIIINLINGMIYVGGTINLKSRRNQHFNDLKIGKHHSIHLQRAYDKYGPDAFEFIIVELIEDKNLLNEIEQLWINASDCCNKEIGYNISSVAQSVMFGRKHSKETLLKLSLAKKGKKFTLEHRLNMSISMKGIKRSEETKKKISIASRNRSPETRAKMSAWQIGRKMSDEAKAKMSLAKKAREIK